VLRSFTAPVVGGPQPQSLAILVDDVHFGDAPSVRLLAYLCERIAALPIVVVVSVAPGEPGTDRQAMSSLKREGATLLHPAALSPEGASTLVQHHFPRADAEFCAACHQVTGGDPFLLNELLAQLRTDEREPHASAAELAGVSVDAVVTAVAARTEGMSPVVHEVLKATAVLTGGASLRQVAAVTELGADEVLGPLTPSRQRARCTRAHPCASPSRCCAAPYTSRCRRSNARGRISVRPRCWPRRTLRPSRSSSIS
jgi:predicted ATPase